MRLLWVQQWAVLPVIVEDRGIVNENIQGGRVPVGGQPMDSPARARLSDRERQTSSSNVDSSNVSHGQRSQGEFAQQQIPGSSSSNMSGHHASGYQSGRGVSPNTFNMSNLTGALPEYQVQTPSHTSHHDQHQYFGGASSGAANYQTQQFSGQTPLNTGNYPTHPSHYAPAYPHVQGYAQIQPSPHSLSGGPSPIQSTYPGGPYFVNSQQQYMHYSGQYGQPGQPQHGPYSSYGSELGHPYGQHSGEISTIGTRFPYSGYLSAGAVPFNYMTPEQHSRPGGIPGVGRSNPNTSSGSIPSTPRGPPRKPKQSGHALWVGNLPSGTIVSDLKDHFSKNATKDIDSVFLISKSNCAFVNYRTEAACAAAMTRFHDSRFQGVRLVCRLRRSTAVTPAPGIPTGPAALTHSVASTQTAFEAITQNRDVSSRAMEEAVARSSLTGDPAAKVFDKYFVLKSLTVEDMDLSVRNGIWATQAHNEEALNKAYETAENVYLIFSANKSGEYFGFARMSSPINEESSATLNWAPRGETAIDDPDVPRSIPTPATENAPKGRIIDDSARGTIFWEADPEDEEVAPIIDHEVDKPHMVKAERADEVADEEVLSGDAQSFGKPFKIEWLATNRLPFYRTRGLRNPWNANREVKIARDGTELETSVGRRLVQMFQKTGSEPGPPQQTWTPGRPAY